MTDETTFPHVRRSDNECVGYLRMTEDGQFVPIDLLWNEVAEPLELTQAEALLEELGLSYLAEPWWLEIPDHPERVKVRIQEVTPDQVVLSNADYGYPADIGAPFTVSNPASTLHRTVS